MKYTRLGHTGLEVSRICLGCMSFGDPNRGSHAWTLPEEQSRPLLRAAWEAGINFFDTANVYSLGSSEEIVGKVLKELAPRDELVIATKVHGTMRPGPNGGGLSRKVIMDQIDASLRRLGTDHVDLYQIHRFDPATPIEETLEALHDVVRAGKARYIGASSMLAWQFSKLNYTARLNGWTPFVSMQNHLNLMQREEEKEMLPLCIDQGVGQPHRDRRSRQASLRRWRRGQPADQCRGRSDRQSARCENGAGGAGLGVAEAARRRPHRRRHQARPSHRCRRRPRYRAHPGRNHPPRIPLPPHRLQGVLISGQVFARAGGLSLPALLFLLAVLLVLRMAIWVFADPMGDEAYYWVWGQHPGWSYFDHPPLQAWMQSVSTAILGPGRLALRLPTLLTLLGTLCMLALFARRDLGSDWPAGFALSAIVLLGSPLFMIYTTIATPDHLLVFLSLAAVYAMARFLEAADENTQCWHWLWLAALAAGLACLTKYIGLILLIGFGATVLFQRRWWLLLRWQTYAALALVVVLQTPVLLWNVETGFSSFRLHLVDRQALGFGLTWRHLLSFVLQLLVLVGPFLLWPLLRSYRLGFAGFARESSALGQTTWILSTTGFAAVSLGNFVSGHWNIVAQAMLVPTIAQSIGRRAMLLAHWLYGVVMASLLLINYAIYPVLGTSTLETYRSYGWADIAAAYAEAVEQVDPGFEAASHYMLASQLSLALGRANVTSLSRRQDQFDYWFDDDAHLGQSALILDDVHSPLEADIADDFTSVAEIRRIDIRRHGVLINSYRIYLAVGYLGQDDGQRYQF